MTQQDHTEAGLVVSNLVKSFTIQTNLLGQSTKQIHAVNDVSFRIPPGTSLGLVGESGCGKSTVARTLLRLVEPTAGTVTFQGEDFLAARGAKLRSLRQRIQIVFQDPYSSLNPRMTIRQILEEPMHVHRRGTSAEIHAKAETVLQEVGLPVSAMDRFPHEFSGGQRQRIGIARSLVLDPELIIADEPVSALDVSVQAQILNLLEKLRKERGLSFLFVSHDLGVIRHFCDRVAVMYLGRIVEEGPTSEVLDHPRHPYTRMLRGSSPVPDPRARLELERIFGEVPSPADPPHGCTFHPRCPKATGLCRSAAPELRVCGIRRKVACYFPEEG